MRSGADSEAPLLLCPDNRCLHTSSCTEYLLWQLVHLTSTLLHLHYTLLGACTLARFQVFLCTESIYFGNYSDVTFKFALHNPHITLLSPFCHIIIARFYAEWMGISVFDQGFGAHIPSAPHCPLPFELHLKIRYTVEIGYYDLMTLVTVKVGYCDYFAPVPNESLWIMSLASHDTYYCKNRIL